MILRRTPLFKDHELKTIGKDKERKKEKRGGGKRLRERERERERERVISLDDS